MTVSQIIFLIALAIIALCIVGFAVFVLSTSTWGATDRWQRRRRKTFHA